MAISLIQRAAFCLFQFVFILNFLLPGLHCQSKLRHLMASQIAEGYGAKFLSLTDAAQIIELAAEVLRESGSNQIVGENEDDKLERTSYWICGNFTKAKKGPFAGWFQKEPEKWQHGYSTRLCQNMYRFLAMVDIELLMFKAKLVKEVENKHLFDLFYWKEKRVYDRDILNFKMSRLFAFARNLTIRFLKFGDNSKGRQLLFAEPFGGKSINIAYYLDLLRKFDEKTLNLLQLIEGNPKFRMSEEESFWDWLKNKKHEVFVDVHNDVNKKPWFQNNEERTMLLAIYETILLETPVNLGKIGQGKSTIYEKKEEPWFKIFKSADGPPKNGLIQLYEQSPWYMPRIHKMVEIYAQIHMKEKAEYAHIQEKQLKIDEHLKKGAKVVHNPQEKVQNKQPQKGGKKVEETEGNGEEIEFWQMGNSVPQQQQQMDKTKEEKKKDEENEEIEHPKEWHLMSSKHASPSLKMLKHNEVLELLRIFDTEKFRELAQNTGADAFRHFFTYEVENLGISEVNEESVKGTGEIIMDKVEKILNALNLVLLVEKDIPVRLGDEILSYEEVNVYTLATFYKFAVHLASEYLEFENKKLVKSHDANGHAANGNTGTGTVATSLHEVKAFFRKSFDFIDNEEKETERTEPKGTANVEETNNKTSAPAAGVEKESLGIGERFNNKLARLQVHMHLGSNKHENGGKKEESSHPKLLNRQSNHIRKRRNAGVHEKAVTKEQSMFDHAMQTVTLHVMGKEEINWAKKPDAVEMILLYQTRLEQLKDAIQEKENEDEFGNLKSVIFAGNVDNKSADLLEDMTFNDRFKIQL